MKPTPPRFRVPRTDDAVMRGMDIALTVGVFFLIGFGLDSWLNTTPIFSIALTLLAAIGFFVSMKYRYDEKMDALETERTERAAGTRT